MTQRPFNFSAGPATLPDEVLAHAAAEMLDWHGSGMGVMEMSHRSPQFQSIAQSAQDSLRRLLAVPPEFHILFMQGGGLAENAIVPLNLARRGAVDFVISGAWSAKSYAEAQRYCDAAIAAGSVAPGGAAAGIAPFEQWRLRPQARYVHLCSNETIHGVECHELPDLRALGSQAELVIDCSSHILSRPIDWRRVGLAYAGAQKNIGPAGLTVVIVRDDLLGHADAACPSAFNYATVAQHQSMYNTPPTYAIYIAGLVFDWITRQGGVAAMEERALERSGLLYQTLDASEFYANPVAVDQRSRMNIPFFLADERLNDAFLAEARARSLLQLKGHKSVGGMRASLYNAMPVAGAHALVAHLNDFAQHHG